MLVIEDGPTLTHGEMKIGAGVVASQRNGAKVLVDPRPYLVGSLVDTFNTYPDIGTLLPAMGYGADQIKDLEATINAADCDVVVIGTPIDLGRILDIDKPHTRVTYDLDEIGSPNLTEVLSRFAKDRRIGGADRSRVRSGIGLILGRYLIPGRAYLRASERAQQPSRVGISVMVPNSLPASSVGSVFRW